MRMFLERINCSGKTLWMWWGYQHRLGAARVKGHKGERPQAQAFSLLTGCKDVSHSLPHGPSHHDETVSPNSFFLRQILRAGYFGTRMQKFEPHSAPPPISVRGLSKQGLLSRSSYYHSSPTLLLWACAFATHCANRQAPAGEERSLPSSILASTERLEKGRARLNEPATEWEM